MEVKIVLQLLIGLFFVVNISYANSDDALSRQIRGAKRANRCRYSKGDWGECDNGMMTRTLTLKKARGGDCEQTKTISKPCKEARNERCKYSRKGEASECVDGLKTISRTLLQNQPESCEPTKTITKPCRNKDKGKKSPCKYSRDGEGGECVDGQKIITKTLLPGQSESCEPTKTVTKSCRRGKRTKRDICKYTRGEESAECVDGQKIITKTLLPDQPESCEPTKTVTKPCKNNRNKEGKRGLCKYSRSGAGGECVDGQKTITRSLLPDQPESCEPTKTVTKKCKEGGRRRNNNKKRGRNGKCSFGPWGEFGACENGVMTRTREVTSDTPMRCQKRSVQTRAC